MVKPMIEIDVLYRLKTGEQKNETKSFNNRVSALRFMYGIERKGNIVLGWKCEHSEDNDYLGRRFKLKYEKLL